MSSISWAMQSSIHSQCPNWTLDVYIDVDASLPLEFRVDTPGTFELICVPHEALGMVGTITVT